MGPALTSIAVVVALSCLGLLVATRRGVARHEAQLRTDADRRHDELEQRAHHLDERETRLDARTTELDQRARDLASPSRSSTS